MPLSSGAGSSAEDSSSANESTSDKTTAAAEESLSKTLGTDSDGNEKMYTTLYDRRNRVISTIVTYFMSNLPAELVPEETTPGETTPGETTPGESTTETAVTPSTTGSAPTTGNTPDNGSVPGTGDTNNISILLFLLLFSGCALAAVVTIGHKKKKSRKNGSSLL